jgi:N-methylhydantoinase B
VASYRSERHYTRPWGLFGGLAAEPWITEVQRADGTIDNVPSKARLQLAPGDVLRVLTGGGGGYGDPLERSPQAVLADVLDEKISRDAALQHYGVVIEEDDVDEPATQRLRQARKVGGAAALTYDYGKPIPSPLTDGQSRTKEEKRA